MGRRRAESLAVNLPQLQNLIKRDPASYRDEFLQQLRHYEASLQIFLLKPAEEAREFGELCMFLSHVVPCYRSDAEPFGAQLMGVLQQHYATFHPTLRRTLVQCLILLRNKDMIPVVKLLELFFQLFRCPDKPLRQLLYSHIVTDIKNCNANHKNNQLNKTLQNLMYSMVNDANELAAKKSLDVMVELYRKQVWDDAKTVNVIAQACLSPVSKIASTALQFLLNGDTPIEEDDDDKDVPNLRDLQFAYRVGKKTKKREQRLENALKTIKRRENIKKKQQDTGSFLALHLINDPQGFAEKLFNKLRVSNDKFEGRLLLMNVLGRLIGVHQLILLNFYPFLQKYLQPQQREVAQILTVAAQACHTLVPPDAVEPVVQAIAHNFVADHCAPEVITMGLNAIRELAARCPPALSETLLRDLAQYKNNKDKGVMISARSLIGLYREVDPTMLHKKDRGKTAQENLGDFRLPQFGQTVTYDHVPGAELLQAMRELEESAAGSSAANGDDEGAKGEEGEWDGWETASDEDEDEDDDGDEWVTVPHSDDEDEGGKGDGKATKERDTAAALLKAAQSRRDPGQLLEAQRILTPADFAEIKRLRQQADLAKLAMSKGQKRKLDQASTEQESTSLASSMLESASFVRSADDIVDTELLLRNTKKRKHTYEERMASIEAGREGREKYGSTKGTKERGSLTNREKAKKKNFGMVRYKKEVVSKQFRSMRDKQIAHQQAVAKEKKKVH